MSAGSSSGLRTRLTVLMLALAAVGLAACGGGGGGDDDGGGAGATGDAGEGGSVAGFCDQAREAEAEGSLVFELHIFGPDADVEDAFANLEDLEDAAGEPLKSELTVIREWMAETLELTTEEYKDREQTDSYDEDVARVREAAANVKGYLIDRCGFEDDE